MNAYPLAWPIGFPRTDQFKREQSRMTLTLPAALRLLSDEVRRMNGSNLVLSSNCTLGQDKPKDPGVVAYFTWEKEQMAVPCDRWRTVAENVNAIAKTLEAMRGMERWGAKHMIRSMFMGLKALPSSERVWRDVMGFHPASSVSAADIQARFRERVAELHPDRGGSESAMAELNRARQEALREVV